MDLEEIRALLAVSEFGSFIGAARSTSITRSTLRRRIESLEARVGASLVVRTLQGVQLTPAGELVAREGRLVTEHARALLQSARSLEPVSSRPVSIVLPQGLPAELLTALFALLTSAVPDLRIELDYSSNPRASLVEDADLVVLLEAQELESPWERVELYRMRESLLASDAYLAQHGAPRDVADLERHRLAVYQGPGEAPTLLPLRGGGMVQVTPCLATPDIHLLHTLASSGHVLAYAPDAGIGPLLPTQNTLSPVLETSVGRDTCMWLVAPAATARMPHVRAIVNVVGELLGSLRG